MGKNHRHSKKLKSERNKVQIKSKTKFLPKGQNVTNTAFKIRPIVLQEQLKERQESSLTNKKKANIDELVSKLKHFSDTIKTESCQDLKDLILSNPFGSIQIYLSAIIQNGSALVQDRERKVRRAAVKLLHTVFEKMSLNSLRPFFGYILTNLKCAMTNINKHIQEDSLLLLDAVLESQSGLIAENFADFFPNFLLLISKTKGHSNERSLSLNLDGKITSVKWRVKVLARLYGILNALNATRRTTKQKTAPMTLDAKGTVFIPVYRDIPIYENIDSVLFAQKTSLDENSDGHLVTLTQLLFDIYMEIIPEKINRVGDGTIFTTDEAVSVFICVVNVLKLLQQSGKDAIFAEGKSVQFLDSLMANFPYSHNRKSLEIVKEFPESFGSNHHPSCVEENLTIVHIFVTLRVKNARSSPRHKSLVSYIRSAYENYWRFSEPRLKMLQSFCRHYCLRPKFRFTGPTLALLVKILREILLDDRALPRKLGINESELLDDISDFYTSGKVPEKFKFDILEILTNSKHQKQQWMEQLGGFMCESHVSGRLIDAILDSCRKGEVMVHAGMRKSLGRILENLPNLEITGVENVEVAWQNLASAFFYVSDLSVADLEEIRNFVNSHSDLPVSRHLKNVLDFRLNSLR